MLRYVRNKAAMVDLMDLGIFFLDPFHRCPLTGPVLPSALQHELRLPDGTRCGFFLGDGERMPPHCPFVFATSTTADAVFFLFSLPCLETSLFLVPWSLVCWQSLLP